MSSYLTSEECWDLNRRWVNATENGWYGLMHDLVGWQLKRHYWTVSGEFVTIEWESDPFPSLVCPRCDDRVAAGEVETITIYRKEGDHLCRSKAAMCCGCRGEIGEMEEWLRGEDGRWLRTEDCEAVA